MSNKLYKMSIHMYIGLIVSMLRVWIRCLFAEKTTLSALWKVFYATFGYCSSIYSFAILVNTLTAYDKIELFFEGHVVLLILFGLGASIIHNHERITYKMLTSDNIQLITKVSDLFCIRASSYVIPTNTYFRTIMEGEYISYRSVQGAFQLRYFKDNPNELYQAITENLEHQGIAGEKCTDIHGDVKRYPIGTVAKVDYNGKHYYFVAICNVNEFGKPIEQEYSNITKALDGLLETINNCGHCDDLAMPLIGTGRAAIREATIEKVVEETFNRVIAEDKRIAQKILLCINPRDYIDGRVDMNKIGKYVDYRNEYTL